MKMIIKTRYIYKNSINNICYTIKCSYFNNYNDNFLIDNIIINTDNINAIYIEAGGYTCAVYEDRKTIRPTDIPDEQDNTKAIALNKYFAKMEALQKYNFADDSKKIYSEIYNDKKQKTSTEDNAERATLQLLECLYNKYIIKAKYIKQIQYKYDYTDKQKITFLFENGYRQIFYNIPTKMAFFDKDKIK